MVAAYSLIEDLADKLGVDSDDVFLMAAIEYAANTDFESTPPNLAAVLYGQWEELHVIPKWVEDWAIDQLIDKKKGGLDAMGHRTAGRP
jgi:hypothetical protein